MGTIKIPSVSVRKLKHPTVFVGAPKTSNEYVGVLKISILCLTTLKPPVYLWG